MYERDHAQKMHYILMPQEQGERGAADHLAVHSRSWAVHQWIARTQAARLEYQQRASQRVVVEMPDADELTFRVWKDMAEEPYKYGDDITEWLDLDDEVMRGPKRWRAGAFWQTKEDEYTAKEWQRVLGLLAKAANQQQIWREEAIARQNAAAARIQAAWRAYVVRCWEKAFERDTLLATRIQALWRGYSTRVRQTWRDCAKCLTHGTCVETVEEEHVCRCCWGEANLVEDEDVTPVEDRDICGPTTYGN